LRQIELDNNIPFDPLDDDEETSPANKIFEVECYETEENEEIDEKQLLMLQEKLHSA